MNFVSDFDADHNEIIERIRFLKGETELKRSWIFDYLVFL